MHLQKIETLRWPLEHPKSYFFPFGSSPRVLSTFSHQLSMSAAPWEGRHECLLAAHMISMLSFFPALLIRSGKVEVLGGFFLPGERGLVGETGRWDRPQVTQGSHKPLQQSQLQPPPPRPPCPLPTSPELPARPWVPWLSVPHAFALTHSPSGNFSLQGIT